MSIPFPARPENIAQATDAIQSFLAQHELSFQRAGMRLATKGRAELIARLLVEWGMVPMWPEGFQPPAEACCCSDCPPIGYPTDATRCADCPRRKEAAR